MDSSTSHPSTSNNLIDSNNNCTIETNSVYKDVVCKWLNQNNYRYLYVKHTTGQDHYHFYVETKKGGRADVQIRKGVLVSSKNDSITPPVLGVDIKIHRARQTIEQWLIYVRHEHTEEFNMALCGSIVGEYADYFNNITFQEASKAKTAQLKRKAETSADLDLTAKKRFLQTAVDIVKKYNLEQTTDMYNKLSTEDWMTLTVLPRGEYFIEAAIERYKVQRLALEASCRTKDENQWRWFQIGLYNYYKTCISPEQKTQVLKGNIDYILAGYELLQQIFKINDIDFKQFCVAVRRVLECEVEKKNSLYLVGASDAGKSTLSRLLCEPFLRACIGQAGNASQFIFQDVPNKSLIQIEEAVFMPNTVDDFKSILGGETNIAINVKNKKNQLVKVRTPVITTSNSKPWSDWCPNHELTFMNRGYLFQFNKAIEKEWVDKLCQKYIDVCPNRGKIWLSIDHFMFMIHMQNNMMADVKACARKMMGGLIALARKDLNCTENWLTMTLDEFKEILRTPYPEYEPELTEDQDLEDDNLDEDELTNVYSPASSEYQSVTSDFVIVDSVDEDTNSRSSSDPSRNIEGQDGHEKESSS